MNIPHLTQWQVVVLLFQEIDISGRDDPHQLAAHLAVVCNGDATEAVARLGLEDVSHSLMGAHHHRVCDEALLVPLEGGRKHGKTGNWDVEGLGVGRGAQRREQHREHKAITDYVLQPGDEQHGGKKKLL